MLKKPSWIWHLYFLIYCVVTAHQVWQFADPYSNINTYYHILIAYNPGYAIEYARNALSVILNTLSIVTFYLFLQQIYWLSKSFWRWFLLFRLCSDLTGRIYETNVIKSLFYQDLLLGRDTLILLFLLLLPSYIALINYAFSRPAPKTHPPADSET